MGSIVRHLIAAAAIVVCAGEPAAALAEERAPVIVRPDWREGPNASIMERYFPKGAVERGVSGTSSIRCVVDLDGRLNDCVIVSEHPQGEGFGEAALALAKELRMTPQLVDGVPTAGATVTVPTTWFVPPEGDPAGPPRWIRTPTREQFMRHYPPEARAAGIHGWAIIRCDIDHYGRLKRCRSLDEFPADSGFGPAAVALSRHLQMDVRTKDGIKVGNSTLTLPIRFSPQ